MLASSTVENYLKAILQNQKDLSPDKTLVLMGHITATLHVTPGTATTMVKALAESGLVCYEPYSASGSPTPDRSWRRWCCGATASSSSFSWKSCA